MGYRRVTNKHSSRSLLCVENAVNVYNTGDKKITVPHRDYYNIYNTQGFTISFMMHPADAGSGTMPVSKEANSFTSAWNFYWSSGNLSFEMYDSAGTGIYASAVLSPSGDYLNRKYLITGVYNNTTGKISIYVNGIFASTSVNALTGNAVNINPLCIGGSYIDSFRTFNGSIASVAIYNKALTAIEVGTLMTEVGLVPKALHANVVGHWTSNQRYGKDLWNSMELYNYAKPSTLSSFSADSGSAYSPAAIADQETLSFTMPAFASNPSKGFLAGISNLQVYDNSAARRLYYLLFNTIDNVTACTEAPTFTNASTAYGSTTPQGADWILKRNGNDLQAFRNAALVYTWSGVFTTTKYWMIAVYTAEQPSVPLTFSSSTNRLLLGFRNGYFNLDDNRYYKTNKFPATHGALLNYTDAETGITDKGNQTTWADHYEKNIQTRFSRKFLTNTDRVTTNTTTVPLSSLVNSSLTIEFWAKRAATASGVAFSMGQQFQNNRCPHVKFGNGTVTFDFWNNGVTVNHTRIADWNHYAFVYDHSLLKRRIYINGSLMVEGDTVALNLGTGNALEIGGWGVNTAEFFNGYINDFRIWSIARTQSQIIDTMRKLIGVTTTGLYLEWSLGETINGTVKDYVGTKTGTRAGSSTDILVFRKDFPELINGVLLDATHTISYPLSGTVETKFNGYLVQAYRLKTGQSLTKAEQLYLENNLIYANPNKAIKDKLDAYYVGNSIDTTSGNRILDLIGTNHATLTSTDASAFTVKSIKNIRLGL